MSGRLQLNVLMLMCRAAWVSLDGGTVVASLVHLLSCYWQEYIGVKEAAMIYQILLLLLGAGHG